MGPNRYGSNLSKAMVVMPVNADGDPAAVGTPSQAELIVDGAPVGAANPLPISIPSGGVPVVVGATANSAGNSTITPTGHQQIQIVTWTGVARTSVLILAVADAEAGDVLEIRSAQPATAAIVQEIRNATAGGTLLYSYTTDGSGADHAYFKLYFNGTAWTRLAQIIPVV